MVYTIVEFLATEIKKLVTLTSRLHILISSVYVGLFEFTKQM